MHLKIVGRDVTAQQHGRACLSGWELDLQVLDRQCRKKAQHERGRSASGQLPEPENGRVQGRQDQGRVEVQGPQDRVGMARSLADRSA